MGTGTVGDVSFFFLCNIFELLTLDLLGDRSEEQSRCDVHIPSRSTVWSNYRTSPWWNLCWIDFMEMDFRISRQV
jgi:hypothetical protein